MTLSLSPCPYPRGPLSLQPPVPVLFLLVPILFLLVPFYSQLEALGYDTVWRKRPRRSSEDGCCIAWKRSVFQLETEPGAVEYIDRYDATSKEMVKDRIALIALLTMRSNGRSNGRRVVVVSTHLTRNPEDPRLDQLRAKQIGQVLHRAGSKYSHRPAAIATTATATTTRDPIMSRLARH
jgi:hypothetical protein